jgi:uncharacterized protein (DUF885 family)
MVTAEPLQPLSAAATDEERAARYKLILQRLQLMLEGTTLEGYAHECQQNVQEEGHDQSVRVFTDIHSVDLSMSDETDWTARMATAVAELHASMEYFSWTASYKSIQYIPADSYTHCFSNKPASTSTNCRDFIKWIHSKLQNL